MTQDALIAELRRALRAALLRHQADRAAGLETEDVRAVGRRLSALLIEKQTHGPDPVADMELRAAMAAALAAELDALTDGEA